MEEATRLRESATDVAEAMAEIEGYRQRLKDLAIEVRAWYFAIQPVGIYSRVAKCC